MESVSASRTAVVVCQGRAAADGRLAAHRFVDPTAVALLRQSELVPVEQVRSGVAPTSWGERAEYELIRASAEVMVTRTVAIDDAVRARLNPQVVILGAGLDGRAWRMPELGDAEVFEVDHPASQQDKRERVHGLTPLAAEVHFVAVDLSRKGLEAALSSEGFRPLVPTTWVWEGVVPYLSRDEVAATVTAIGKLSAVGSRLIVNYQSPALSATVGLLAMRVVTRLGGRPSPVAHEPRRSSWTPAAMRNMLSSHGFAVRQDEDLLALAARVPLLVSNRRSLRAGHVAVADRN